MILWTFGELARLTPKQLHDLEHTIPEMLGHLGAGTVARTNALTSLDNIRRIRVQKDWHP